MSEVEHTPGKWIADDFNTPNGYVTAVRTDTENIYDTASICECFVSEYGEDDPIISVAEAEANARLIASAPDMAAEIARLKEANAELVEACKRLLDDIRRYTQIDHAEYIAVCQQAVVAIAKAEQFRTLEPASAPSEDR